MTLRDPSFFIIAQRSRTWKLMQMLNKWYTCSLGEKKHTYLRFVGYTVDSRSSIIFHLFHPSQFPLLLSVPSPWQPRSLASVDSIRWRSYWFVTKMSFNIKIQVCRRIEARAKASGLKKKKKVKKLAKNSTCRQIGTTVRKKSC